MTTDLIKLAEAMGWTCFHDDRGDVWMPPGMTGNDNSENAVTANQLPDPFTDERHCHALIKHLNGEGYSFDITISIESIGSFIVLRHIAAGTVSHWQGDNWMHGVCELALKVIA